MRGLTRFVSRACPIRAKTCSSLPRGSAALVVGSLVRDGDVVRVAFFAAGRRDPHEAGAIAECVERRSAGVTHAAAHAADELVHDLAEPAGVGNPPLDAFGDELAG